MFRIREAISSSNLDIAQQVSKQYITYILSNKNNNVLYVGITSNLPRRINDHKQGRASRFTTTYSVSKLVYYEQSESITSAMAREKQLKGWRRSKKIALIESENPTWCELKIQ